MGSELINFEGKCLSKLIALGFAFSLMMPVGPHQKLSLYKVLCMSCYV